VFEAVEKNRRKETPPPTKPVEKNAESKQFH
jgi:hypothetical protein